MSWLDALTLRDGEEIVDSWQGIREIIGETFEVPVGKNQKEKKKITTKERKEGVLVLTTQRLLFVEGQEPDGSTLGEAIHVSLMDVDKIGFERAPVKSVDKTEGYETHVFSLKKVGKKKDFDKFKKLLDEHIKKRRDDLSVKAKKAIRFKIS
ncbi:MAG: hypothetical protein NWE92_12495 [Candidatus Bathyarchaeota archaeon]|nr:hypothetical protein [Candidatus Bathyarchaeota archaeon]